MHTHTLLTSALSQGEEREVREGGEGGGGGEEGGLGVVIALSPVSQILFSLSLSFLLISAAADADAAVIVNGGGGGSSKRENRNPVMAPPPPSPPEETTEMIAGLSHVSLSLKQVDLANVVLGGKKVYFIW